MEQIQVRIHRSKEEADVYSALEEAYSKFLSLPSIRKHITPGHLEKTPYRVVKALKELISGYDLDPVEILKTSFEKGNYNQMITVKGIDFTSLCAHHMLPFSGKVNFAYIPNRTLVGLSKIPRIIEAFSRRLQVQESLSEQLVDCFQKTVKPKGCAVMIESSHLCMSIRGVKKNGLMQTTALKGIFQRDASAKAEFLDSIRR